MSIKRCTAFVLLALLIYGGVYITVYGMRECTKYSGAERGFYSRKEDLADGLNIKGSVETVTKLLGTEDITKKVLGIPLKQVKRYYFALPLGYSEDKNNQLYCVIATENDKDVEVLKSLLKSAPAPLDPNAPRFEFHGLVMSTTLNVHKTLTEYLRSDVYTSWIFDEAIYKNVNRNIAPYIIYVKSDTDDNYSMMTVTIGLIVMLAGTGLFILLAVRTYKKAHMYD